MHAFLDVSKYSLKGLFCQAWKVLKNFIFCPALCEKANNMFNRNSCTFYRRFA